MLAKRAGFRRAFPDFDPSAGAPFNVRSVESVAERRDIARDGQKIEASTSNTTVVLGFRRKVGTFDAYTLHLVRLRVRRLDDLRRAAAGRGDGERPGARVLPPRRGRT